MNIFAKTLAAVVLGGGAVVAGVLALRKDKPARTAAIPPPRQQAAPMPSPAAAVPPAPAPAPGSPGVQDWIKQAGAAVQVGRSIYDLASQFGFGDDETPAPGPEPIFYT